MNDRELLEKFVVGHLTIAEFCFFRDALVSFADREIANLDAAEIVRLEYKKTFRKEISLQRTKILLESIGDFDIYRRTPYSFAQAAASLALSCSAAPNIKRCLQCSRHLVSVSHEQRSTTFYNVGEVGKTGRLYVKRCHECNIEYYLDGYQYLDSKDNLKRMYTREHEHPQWFRWVIQLNFTICLEDKNQFL